MIEKKRLEELIKQGATIYWLVDNEIRELPCKDIPTFWLREDIYDVFDRPIYETKEEAKWHKEFGCIEKPQYLKFPTWKQIENTIERMKKFGLVHNDKMFARIVTKDSIYYFKLCKDLDTFTFSLKQVYIGDDLCEQISSKFPQFLGKATKENYTLACRKAKELFLGEKK